MKQQVLIIHGGDAFSTYEEYLDGLRNKTVDLEREGFRSWKSSLQDELGESYEVIAPSMPNKQNAKYLEWQIWFEKHLPFLRDGVMLVGHSLGGIFLAKYLAGEPFPVGIRATFLIAPPYNGLSEGMPEDFFVPEALERLSQQGGEIFIFHSTDDAVVPFENAEAYAQKLPDAELERFTDRGHFNQEEFPELLARIRTCASTPA